MENGIYPFLPMHGISYLFARVADVRPLGQFGPLRSLKWFGNNCYLNAALHAAAGLRLWLQPAHDDDSAMDSDSENLQGQEFEEQEQEQGRATE